MSSLTVYKASAGSGKTFTLVAEYVALLLAGDPATAHRSILAVTFTNKATAEMKERVLHELQELAEATGDDESDFEKKISKILPRLSRAERRSRAATALHAILHDYDHFRVTTIDSFFQSLLTAVAHELGLPAGVRVEIDDSRVVDAATDRLLASVDKREDVRRWVLDFVREHIAEDKSWDVSRDIKSLAHEITKERFLTHEEKLLPLLNDSNVVKDYVSAIHAVKSKAEVRLKEVATGLDKMIGDAGGYDQFSRGNDVRNYLTKVANGTAVKPSDTMLRRMAGPDVWLRKPDLKKPALVATASRLAEELSLVERTRCEETLLINTCNLTLKYISPLRLIGEVGREATDINREENRFMLAKTPIFFKRMVGQEDASFVFERVGEQFRHIMIDEFQDTSGLQWDNFRRLLIENMSQGNSCLLVGDVKQAIYRFRGGDWKILNGIEDAFKGRQKVTVKPLDVNYRSGKTIIDFNNDLFKRVAEKLDEWASDSCAKDFAKTYKDVEQKDHGDLGGHVEVELIIPQDKKSKQDKAKENAEDLPGWDTPVPSSNDAEEVDKEDELYVATRIAAVIRQLHDELKVPYRDIAILVRKNFQTTELLNQLAEVGAADLPIVSDEAFTLEASPAVTLLIETLRYLDDPSNDVARGYVCSSYAQAPDILKQLPAFMEGKHREALLRLPLYELLEQLISLYHLDKDEAAAPYLFYLLDAVADAVESGRSSISQLVEFWDEKLHKQAIPAGEIDGVRILTIHKSKGLAFHTVLMPACDWELEKDRLGDLMWCEPTAAPFSTLPLVPIQSTSTMQESLYAADYANEHHDQRTENLNLMYVAFTRAKRNLYVWAKTQSAAIDSKNPPKSLTMGDVLRACLGDNGFVSSDPPAGPVRKNDEEDKKDEKDEQELKELAELKKNCQTSFSTYAPHVKFRQSEAAHDFVLTEGEATEDYEVTDDERQQVAYINRGKLLHRVFASIRTTADVAPALNALAQSGLIASTKEMNSLRHLIEKRIADPTVSPWFDGSWQVHNECNILIRKADGTFTNQRPDRVMVRNDRVVVVDFKFARPCAEHQEQVSDYCKLLTRMGYNHVEGKLWYVYSGEVKDIQYKQ